MADTALPTNEASEGPSTSQPTSPARSEKSDSVTNNTSSTTPTGNSGPDFPHDLVSSYTEISFGGDSDLDLDECAELDETTDLASDPEKAKQMSSSLSLPQLSSTIVDWSERARAEYDAKFGDAITVDKKSIDHPSKEKLVGTVDRSEDGKISFVAADIEEKLKLSARSPGTSAATSEQPSPSRSETFLNRSRASSIASTAIMPPIEKLETQAKIIARNVDQIIRSISAYTHNVTSLTLESTKTFEKSLSLTCDSIDSNIKSMYQLMAKYEELCAIMLPINKLSDEIKDIKRIIGVLEKEMETNR